MKPSHFPRLLVLGGYLLVAAGLVIQIWLMGQEPHSFLVGPVALAVSFILIGLAWCICLPALQAVSEKTVRQGLLLFGLAGAVLFMGNLLYIWDWTGGWDFLSQGLAAVGYLAVTVGFWASVRGTATTAPASEISINA